MDWVRRHNENGRLAIAAVLSMALLVAALLPLFSSIPQSARLSPARLPGQSVTFLPDGRVLLIGGEGSGGALSTASIWDPRTGVSTQLTSQLRSARAWHTSTMLPDGTVFVFGGVGSGGEVLSSPEIFNPATQSFELLPNVCCLVPRARHTATLLTDGHVLITGGTGANGQTLSTTELFDPFNLSSVNLPPLTAPRQNHTATLLPDGTVLLQGGLNHDGSPVESADLFDPSTQRFTLADLTSLGLQTSVTGPALMASLPVDGSRDVPTDSILSLRFSKPLRVETVNSQTMTLSGPKGVERIQVVAAEGGLLAFVTPAAALLPGSTYSVTVNGAVDRDGLLLPLSGFSFKTESSATSTPSSAGTSPNASLLTPNQESASPLTPDEKSASRLTATQDDDWEWKGTKKNGKPYSEWQDLSPLKAQRGETALAGQVLDLKGQPLANVALNMPGEYGGAPVTVRTDDTGRFLLSEIKAGWGRLLVDGRGANTPGKTYGVFEIAVNIKEGETNVLSYTIWMPRIDIAHAVKIDSPTKSEVVLTTPKIPDLEVRIPAGTVIKDHEGNVVTEIGITPIPLDRPPFALPPRDVNPPAFFTVQPGVSRIYSAQGGIRLIYPNYSTNPKPPGSRFDLWHYGAAYRGWYVYGQGSVSEDGRQINPDPGRTIYKFTGAMIGNDPAPPGEGPTEDDDAEDGDPVHLGTGLFVMRKTDLTVSGIIPIELKRVYRSKDTVSRAFGVGSTHPYDIYLYSINNYQDLDLVLADGNRIHYVRTSPGTSFTDAVYEHRAPDSNCPNCVGSPTVYNGSKIAWNGQGWSLRLKNGTEFRFPESCPGCPTGGLNEIRDRNGNRVTISREGLNQFNDPIGNITQITSSNGRWVKFTYDSGNRITQARDNIGRIVNYEYDASNRLIKVTNPGGGSTEYTYDPVHRMTTIKDARGIVYLTNEYDSGGRVLKQTLPGNSSFQFAYTLNANGRVTQTNVTDPGNGLRVRTFNAAGYALSDTRAMGTPAARALIFERQSATNMFLSVTDALNRRTTFAYDALGNRIGTTRLAGTANALTTTFSYEQTFNRLTRITNPLNQTIAFSYDSRGNLLSATDPLGNSLTLVNDAAGQPISITDPLGNTTQFSYESGDLTSVTDPLGNKIDRFTDGAGRVMSLASSIGSLVRYNYDSLNRLTHVIEPSGSITNFGYDANGNVLSVMDARGQLTAFSYNNMDQLIASTDPLLRVESYEYDSRGNLIRATDRKGQSTIFEYDNLNRKTKTTFADLSTITYAYDSAHRLIQVNDSSSGVIDRTYDDFDRLILETTPQGSVGYTYDAAGRRTSMTVAGQPTVNYAYDIANRLIQITQGSSIVSFTYDAAGRRTSLTLPNGILVEYAYDAASRVTGITYKRNGTTLLGDLTYEYDKAGNRTKIGGSFARTGIPQTVNNTNYNAANQQTTFGDKTLTYDNNGNLTSITDANGTTLYSWNARNQLVGISEPNVNASFVYDGFGRRQKKTISGNLTEFLYDGVNPVQETSGATVLANLLTGLGIDEFLTRTDVPASTTSHYLPDALGSAIALADSAGVVQTEYTFEPFGKTTATGVSGTNPFQYTGRENDGTGLYYYRARYYHPQLQRFISEDPVSLTSVRAMLRVWPQFERLFEVLQREPQQLNEYSYVANNPLVYVDPEGELLAPLAQRIAAWLGLGAIIHEIARRLYENSHGTFEDPEKHTEKEPYVPPDPTQLPPPPGQQDPPNPKDPPPSGVKPPKDPPRNPSYGPGRGGRR